MNIITGFSRAVNGRKTNPGEILSLLIKRKNLDREEIRVII
jgi:hypothetical protein